MPAAGIVVENEATNVRQAATTDENGRYFNSIRAGSYKLTVQVRLSNFDPHRYDFTGTTTRERRRRAPNGRGKYECDGERRGSPARFGHGDVGPSG